MPLTTLMLSQLADPFRIGLILALVYTALRNRAVTGRIVPLAAGLIFVAVIIPVTLQTGTPEPLWRLIATGLVANLVLLAVALGFWTLLGRLRG